MLSKVCAFPEKKMSTTFPSAPTFSVNRFMNLSISTAAKPLLKPAILFLVPPAAWRVLTGKDRVQFWVCPSRRRIEGWRGCAQRQGSRWQIMVRKNSRVEVEKACWKSEISIFFINSVHAWRKKNTAVVSKLSQRRYSWHSGKVWSPYHWIHSRTLLVVDISHLHHELNIELERILRNSPQYTCACL